MVIFLCQPPFLQENNPNAHSLGDRVCTRSSLDAVDKRKSSTSSQKLAPVPEYFGVLPCVYNE